MLGSLPVELAVDRSTLLGAIGRHINDRPELLIGETVDHDGRQFLVGKQVG